MKKKLIALAIFFTATSAKADTLNDAVQQALFSNPDVLQNTAKGLSNRQGIDKAKGAFYPSVDLAGGFGREYSLNPTTAAIEGGTGAATLNRTESSVELRQNLFAGGEHVNEYKRNIYLTQAQVWRTEGIAEDMALDVVNRYLTVLMHEQLYKYAVQNLEAHRPVIQMINERTKAGLARDADVYQANGRMALAESNLISAEADLREARINYAKIVGKWPTNLRLPHIPSRSELPPTLEKAIEIGLHTHPTIKSSYADIKEAKAQYSVARAANYPRVDAVLSASKNRNLDGLVGPNNDRMAMLRVTYNVFKGGSDQASIRETAYQVQEAFEVKNRALIDLREAIRLSWNQLTAAAIRLKPLSEHVSASIKTRKAYVEEFKINKRTLLDTLDAQNELYTSQIEYEKGKMAERFARFRVINGMGKLLPYLHLKVPVNVKNNEIFSSAQEHILLNGNMDHVPYPDTTDESISLDKPVPTFEQAKMTPAVVNKNSEVPPQATPKIWYIHSGAFKNEQLARNLVNRLQGLGFPAVAHLNNKLYIVLVGPFEYKNLAGNEMARLKERAKVEGFLLTFKEKPKTA